MRRSGTFASRTLLGDGTRQFRYNYRNQLRKVWRKSDGDSDGLISQYREDAFGRRVLTHSWWELARRVYLDTRFELDINMDAPGGSGGVSKYINGGITSDGPMEARAEWESRIYRTHGELDTHYYDFLVNIPQAEESTDYLGMLGVAHYELRIYGDRYELWDASGPTMIDSYSATTAGWRNIGLRAGINEGVWVDGNKIIDYGVPMGGNLPVAFSTLGVNEGNGIELYECLTYLRSYNRSQAEISNVPGGEVGGYPIITGQSHPPRVKRPFFDGPAAVTVIEVVADSGGSSASDELCTEYEEDGTRARHFFHDGEYTDLYLPNVRRQAALVIRDDADSLVDNEGTLHVHSDEYPLPGVIMVNHFDAVGQPLGYVTPDPFNESYPWGAQGNNVFACPTYGHDDHTIAHGVGVDRAPDETTHIDSSALLTTVSGGNAEADDAGEGQNNTDAGDCCFRSHDPSIAADTAQVCENTAGVHNNNGGQVYEYPPDIVLSGGYDGAIVIEEFRWVPAEPGGSSGGSRQSKETTNEGPQKSSKGLLERAGELAEGVLDTVSDAVVDSIPATHVLPKEVVDEVKDTIKAVRREEAKRIVDTAEQAAGLPKKIVCDPVGHLGDQGASALEMVKDPLWITKVEKIRNAKSPEERRAAIAEVLVDLEEITAMVILGVWGGSNCFVAGTLVRVLKEGLTLEEALALLAGGAPIWAVARLLPIEQIQTGMYVLSRHERSDMAPLAFSLVSETYVRLASNLVQLATATSASGSRGTLTVTEEHPFWVASSNGRKFAPAEPTASGATHTKVYAGTNTATTSRVSQGWAFAGDLQTGHVLSTPDCTESVTVANNVRLSNGPTTVYNFAVEGTATYFVSPPDAPQQCIWVHNAKKYGPKGGKIPDEHKKIVEAREKARAERRNAQAREECGQNPQGSKKEKGAQTGPSGERPSDRRRREQKESSTRERNIGIDEEHSKRPKSNPGGAVGG